MKKFLIFSGIGDSSNEFMSWAKEESKVYDRAIFYYGDREEKESSLLQLSTEFFFKRKGMIWKNFSELYYDFFQNYEYILVCDSDLLINQKDIENTFEMAYKKNFTACSWSRNGKDYGTFAKFFSKYRHTKRNTRSNFIEMNFMIIKKDLIKLLIAKWNSLGLKYSTGVDIVLSNVAYQNNMLPFYIINIYNMYNPHPSEKNNSREIDYIFAKNPDFITRIDTLDEKLIENKFRFIETFCHEDFFINRKEGIPIYKKNVYKEMFD